MPANITEGEKSTMACGTATKPLYIKHISLQDWDNIKRIQAMLGEGKSIADAVRFSLRRTVGITENV